MSALIGPVLAFVLVTGVAADLFLVPRERAFEHPHLRRRRNWFRAGLAVLFVSVLLTLPWQ